MLTDFFHQWNPLNMYGKEMNLDDLLRLPLELGETLRKDSLGICRRIKVPHQDSSIWLKSVYWVQTHLTEKGHLEAIDKLISLFYQRLLESPPQEMTKLHEFNCQLKQLRSLKNDDGFSRVKKTDPSYIDFRLKEIEDYAYSVFTYYYTLNCKEQEEERRRNFSIFKDQIQVKIQELAQESLMGIDCARLFVVIPPDALRSFFEQRVKSINSRLMIIQDLYREIKLAEQLHQGKFIFFSTHALLSRFRVSLRNEVCKINAEAQLIIRNLILNYHLSPFKNQIIDLLDSIGIDPKIKSQEVGSKARSSALMFEEVMELEIERIRHLFYPDPFSV